MISKGSLFILQIGVSLCLHLGIGYWSNKSGPGTLLSM